MGCSRFVVIAGNSTLRGTTMSNNEIKSRRSSNEENRFALVVFVRPTDVVTILERFRDMCTQIRM